MKGPRVNKRGYDPTQHQQDWGTAWNSLRIKAGFPGLRFHDLRHTFITHMVECGISIAVIQTMVGHISMRMVRYYSHIASGIARKAVEVLDREPILVETQDSTDWGWNEITTPVREISVLY